MVLSHLRVTDMEITEVKVFPVTKEMGRLKAFAAIVFEKCFIIRDLKIILGDNGYFVSMPSRRRRDGSFRDIVHPLDSETRKKIEDRIIEEYKSSVGEAA
jgi:stage V sporulation protein G